MFTGVSNIKYTDSWHAPEAERQRRLEAERVDRELAEAEAKAEFYRGH